MRLAALVDLELDVRVLCLDECDQRRKVGLFGTGEQRHHAARLCEQTRDDGLRDLVEAPALRNRFAFYEVEEIAFGDM